LLETTASRGARAAAARLLSDEERARAAQFRFSRDRTLYELAHGLVRGVLAEVTGTSPAQLRFGKATHGKPFLEAPERATSWSFNLSHAHGLVGVALTRDAPIGFDIEHTGRVVEPLEVGETVFGDGELTAWT
jgi:4'-phosphopantetheinyl transferase